MFGPSHRHSPFAILSLIAAPLVLVAMVMSGIEVFHERSDMSNSAAPEMSKAVVGFIDSLSTGDCNGLEESADGQLLLEMSYNCDAFENEAYGAAPPIRLSIDVIDTSIKDEVGTLEAEVRVDGGRDGCPGGSASYHATFTFTRSQGYWQVSDTDMGGAALIAHAMNWHNARCEK